MKSYMVMVDVKSIDENAVCGVVSIPIVPSFAFLKKKK